MCKVLSRRPEETLITHPHLQATLEESETRAPSRLPYYLDALSLPEHTPVPVFSVLSTIVT